MVVSLFAAAAAVTVLLTFFGWQLVDKQAAIEEQRGRSRLIDGADVTAGKIKSRLAETGDKLSAWLANPSSAVPEIEDAVVFAVSPTTVAISPAGGLPFVPHLIEVPDDETEFREGEAYEFSGSLGSASASYRSIAGDMNPQVRAGALLRLGRVQRAAGQLTAAVATYQQLAKLGDVSVSDYPAELA